MTSKEILIAARAKIEQPGKPWDEAASIGEHLTLMFLDEDDRAAGEDD